MSAVVLAAARLPTLGSRPRGRRGVNPIGAPPKACSAIVVVLIGATAHGRSTSSQRERRRLPG
jgi:hypothetical protein